MGDEPRVGVAHLVGIARVRAPTEQERSELEQQKRLELEALQGAPAPWRPLHRGEASIDVRDGLRDRIAHARLRTKVAIVVSTSSKRLITRGKTASGSW